MNTALKSFIRHLDKENIHFEVPRNNDNRILIRTPLDKNSSIFMDILIGFDGDDSRNAQLALWGLGEAENITSELLKKINELNSNFRWFKLCIDEGHFVMSCDFIICENSDDQLMELIIRGIRLADDYYPQLMKCIWS